jgi:urea transport system permease protein
MILGGLFILVVLFLPGGLVSLPKRLAPLWKKGSAKKSETPAATPAPVSKS